MGLSPSSDPSSRGDLEQVVCRLRVSVFKSPSPAAELSLLKSLSGLWPPRKGSGSRHVVEERRTQEIITPQEARTDASQHHGGCSAASLGTEKTTILHELSGNTHKAAEATVVNSSVSYQMPFICFSAFFTPSFLGTPLPRT